MKLISTAIVDDEPLAREGLRKLLAAEPNFRLTCEYGDGVEALEGLEKAKPDLIFLDVQMPGLDGFELLSAIPDDYHPAIVFVTAFDKFAIRAFTVHAIGYLLKPVDPVRFQESLEHSRQWLNAKSVTRGHARFDSLLEDVRKERPRPRRLIVRSVGKIELVPIAEIDYIESAGDYVRIHSKGGKRLHRETMANILSVLDDEVFVRIHRSVIVNADRVKELQPMFKGDYAVILSDGTKLTLSRTYKEKAFSKLAAG